MGRFQAGVAFLAWLPPQVLLVHPGRDLRGAAPAHRHDHVRHTRRKALRRALLQLRAGALVEPRAVQRGGPASPHTLRIKQ